MGIGGTQGATGSGYSQQQEPGGGQDEDTQHGSQHLAPSKVLNTLCHIFFDIVNSDTGNFAGKLAGKFVLEHVG